MMRLARAFLILVMVSFSVMVLDICNVRAEEAMEGAPAAGMANTSIEIPKSVLQAKKSYTYRNFENRDPFVSLILEKMPEEVDGKIRDPREMYDIELMKIVAIIRDAERGYASVRLPDGKYYTLVVGTQVGIHGGQVKEILPDRVVIRQEIMNFKRELVEQIRELKLREEEGQ